MGFLYRLILRAWHLLIQPKRVAIVEACLIGVVSGLAAVFLKQSITWLGSWRLVASYLLPAWLILPAIGIIGGTLSGWLIQRFAPEASGSGIPQVKASLSNIPIVLDLRVALIKLISTILALGSGLFLGRQGPTVHVGAALAAQLSCWVPTSPEYRRQLIASGAAAGLAAGFNAPIAGVLFVIEELLQDFSGITLGTAILASFVGAVVSRLLGGNTLNMGLSNYHTHFSIQSVPFLVLLGLLAGLLGALFCRGILFSLDCNRQFLNFGLPFKIGLAGLLSGLLVAFLPIDLRDSAGFQELVVEGGLNWQFTILAFVSNFLLALLAFGSGCAGGLFNPSLILGSTLGSWVSLEAGALTELAEHYFGASLDLGSGTIYTLTGMGAFFSAVTKVPITAIVIVFEITMDFNLVLPLMIGSVIAYLVSERIFSGSIYSHLLKFRGIQLEKTITIEGQLGNLTAAHIMQRRVETLSSQMSLEDAVQAFSRSHHRGFPVVEQDRLVGIITQTDLANRSQQQLAGNPPLAKIMTPQPVSVRPSDPLTQVLYLLNRHKISRLPVVDGRKLVGIITRADIIRAESDRLTGEVEQTGPKPDPSYVVYQTCAPATGKGRLLVPLSNPQTAQSLLCLAAAIAHDRHYELECLQVIQVPRNRSPSEVPVRTTRSRRLLNQAVRIGKQWRVPVHTQVRVAHDLAQAILETIKERHIDLILMGWKGSTATPGRVFGGVVDTLIRQAGCNVMLVKLQSQALPEAEPAASETGKSQKSQSAKVPQPPYCFDRWLVPVSGGPNIQQALQFLPALVSVSSTPIVQLCQVFQPADISLDTQVLEQAGQFLQRRLHSATVSTSMLCAYSVPEAILDLAQRHRSDVIILGATREGLLQQAIRGNIPEEIARHSDCSVILVRQALNE